MKKNIANDPRYDAVGSSSLREELFTTFLKAQHQPSNDSPIASESLGTSHTERTDISAAEKRRVLKERKERAVREREEKVKAERSKVEAQIDRSRTGLNKEEGDREFRYIQPEVCLSSDPWAALTSRPNYAQNDAGRCFTRPTGTDLAFARTLN